MSVRKKALFLREHLVAGISYSSTPQGNIQRIQKGNREVGTELKKKVTKFMKENEISEYVHDGEDNF